MGREAPVHLWRIVRTTSPKTDGSSAQAYAYTNPTLIRLSLLPGVGPRLLLDWQKPQNFEY
jgi:hypothetical protein